MITKTKSVSFNLDNPDSAPNTEEVHLKPTGLDTLIPTRKTTITEKPLYTSRFQVYLYNDNAFYRFELIPKSLHKCYEDCSFLAKQY